MILFCRIYFEVSCRKIWMLWTHRPMCRRCLVQRTYEWYVHVLFVRYEKTPVQVCSHNRCNVLSLYPRVHVRRIRKSVNEAKHIFLDVMFGVCVYNHRPTTIMHREIIEERCVVGDSIRHTHKIDIWRSVLLVIPYTSGQAGRFECRFCLAQELVSPFSCDDVRAMLSRIQGMRIESPSCCLRRVFMRKIPYISPRCECHLYEYLQQQSINMPHVTDMYTLLNHVIDFGETDQSRYYIACNPFFMQRQ